MSKEALMVRIRKRFLAAGAVGFLTAIAAFLDAGGNAFRDSRPQTALAFDNGNEMANYAEANRLFEKGLAEEDLISMRPYVLRALAKAPGLSPMLRDYALLADMDLVEGDAIKIMEHAAYFSKRDDMTQLWLIEKRAQSGDVEATIAQYDEALRANMSLSAVLFPTLADALSKDTLVEPIVQMLRTEPNWAPRFFLFVANDKQAVKNFPSLINILGEKADALIESGMRERAATLLYQQGRADLAKEVAVGKSDAANIGDFSNGGGRILAPFAWKFLSLATVRTDVGIDGSLEIEASRGAAGLIGRRVISFDHKNVRIDGLVRADSSVENELPWLKFTCPSGSGTLIRANRIGEGLFRYSSNLDNADCDYGDLEILVPSNFSGSTKRYVIKSLRLTRRSSTTEMQNDIVANEAIAETEAMVP